MNVSFESPKPEIRVYWETGKVDESIVDEVLLGIEEEGVPFVKKGADYVDSAAVLGYKAAEASHLGVGIGIAENEIVLHFSKLKEDEPLFTIQTTKDSERLRAIGSNAARLVKRMPFKEL